MCSKDHNDPFVCLWFDVAMPCWKKVQYCQGAAQLTLKRETACVKMVRNTEGNSRAECSYCTVPALITNSSVLCPLSSTGIFISKLPWRHIYCLGSFWHLFRCVLLNKINQSKEGREGKIPCSLSLTGINQENTVVVTQIRALWTILYASLIDLLSFLKPFLERQGDFLAMAERLSAPFAAHLHSVTSPLLHGKLGESTPTPPSKRPKFYPMARMWYSWHLVSQSNSDSFPPCLCYLWNTWKRWCNTSEPPSEWEGLLAHAQPGKTQQQGFSWFCWEISLMWELICSNLLV